MSIPKTLQNANFEQIAEALKTLDLIVFLPIESECKIEYFESDSDFRDSVDYYLKQLYRGNVFELLPDYNNPTIVELTGDQNTLANTLQSLSVYNN